jgi:hypothetical protein
MHPDPIAIHRASGQRIAVLAAALTLLATSLAGVLAPPAEAAGAYDHSITDCSFLNFINSPITELSVPFDGTTFSQSSEGLVEDDGPDAGKLWVWFRQTLNGNEVTQGPGLVPPVGSLVTLPGVGVPGTPFVANDVFVIEVWAVSGIDPNAGDNQTNAARVGDAETPLCSITLTFLPMPNFGGGGGGGGAASAPTVALACAPSSVQAGATVTCSVTGGDPGIDILWRASYNPVFAEAGVTLDADGAGTFSFMVPAAALGQEVMVELVEWTAPVSLGVASAGSLVPTSVPAGEGPGAPVIPLSIAVASALVAGMVVRRWAVELRG